MQSTTRGNTDAASRSGDRASAHAETRWRFGTFVVWEQQRRVESRGQPLRLGPRSFDLLLQLLKRAGELVSKEELLAGVWAGVVVEEASVRVHMSLLRKALGEPGDDDACREWITTVPLRGYRFNGRVARESADEAAPATPRPQASPTRLPARLTGLVGRAPELSDVLSSLAAQRLVTIVGPGGIGKTSVAVRAAELFQQQTGAETAFVDLAPLISPQHVLGTMARSLGIAADLPDPVHAIVQSLAGRNMLMLVDNCEHVLDSLALPAARLLAAAPGLRILATSREALRIAGEYVLRLPALSVPDAEHFALAEALQWPSVELLVERARAAGARDFDESDGPLLAKISRQLDGIPLAIELVAARLGVQSVTDLALRLDDHMRLLSLDNRAASARHRTLAAALDWSIALLDEAELRVFRRLSVFRGRFDAEAALGVAADGMDAGEAFDALTSLAGKSLVSFDGDDAVAPYRLLDTTRSYAAALLEKSGERAAQLKRHVALVLDLMKMATADLPKLPEQAWAERYAYRLDDVRFALATCTREQPDAKTAAALVTASTPLWFHLSQVAEYRDWVAAALELVDREEHPDTETAAALANAMIIALLHTDELNPGLGAICDRALAAALAVGGRVLELQARWGRCTHDIFRGEYAAALRNSETLLAAAQAWSDPAALNLAHRVRAMACHFCGRFEAARRHCGESLRSGAGARRTRTNMVGVDPGVAAKAMLARTLWIQGDAEQALATAREAVAGAASAGHAVSLCAALYGACPPALWSGDFELAGTWIGMMKDEARRCGLVGWQRYAGWFEQGLLLGTAADADHHVRKVSGQFATYDPPHKEMLVTFCPDWVDDAMVARLARGEGLWSAAEVWRAIGCRSERQGATREAEGFYRRALETARQQHAGAWELRAALSLARLWSGTDRPREALALLGEILQTMPDHGNPRVRQADEMREALARRVASADRH